MAAQMAGHWRALVQRWWLCRPREAVVDRLLWAGCTEPLQSKSSQSGRRTAVDHRQQPPSCLGKQRNQAASGRRGSGHPSRQ